jgi:hypothetical protein
MRIFPPQENPASYTPNGQTIRISGIATTTTMTSKRQPHAPVIAKLVTAWAHHQCVRLVPNGGQKGARGPDRHRHQEGVHVGIQSRATLIPIGAISTTAAALLTTSDRNIVPISTTARVATGGSWLESCSSPWRSAELRRLFPAPPLPGSSPQAG